jgi:hypothetical protein
MGVRSCWLIRARLIASKLLFVARDMECNWLQGTKRRRFERVGYNRAFTSWLPIASDAPNFAPQENLEVKSDQMFQTKISAMCPVFCDHALIRSNPTWTPDPRVRALY